LGPRFQEETQRQVTECRPISSKVIATFEETVETAELFKNTGSYNKYCDLFFGLYPSSLRSATTDRG
jgi:hypothetical protein